MVLYDPENMQELWCGWKYLGEGTTNNAAEYSGLLLGIQCARSLGVQKLRVEGDSLLIVRQVNGIYKANEPNLKKLLAAVKDATQHLDSFQIDYIPRAENKRADQLANQAMDTRESFGFDELD
jgi:ribonuclease HI